MKNKEKLYSLTLTAAFLISFLIFISSTVSAATVQNASPTITETNILNRGTAIGGPAIYGDKVVWFDWDNQKKEIHMYNLSTHNESKIITNQSSKWDPVIYGDKVVWIDWLNWRGNFNHVISMYDLSTQTETRITNSGYAYDLDIYGDKIVWTDYPNFNGTLDDEYHGEVYMYDLSTQKKTQITTSDKAYDPKIYGDKIVWIYNRIEDLEGGNADIYIYDISTCQKTKINMSGPVTVISPPAFYGDKIVWADYRNEGNPDIYMYNLSTQKETRITRSGSAIDPAIYGDRIVWSESCNGKNDIYMYNISTHQKTQITTCGFASSPKIYCNWIVWNDDRDGKCDIYMATLDSTLPNSNFSASQLCGKAPLKIKFSDKSIGTPNSWEWSFGDGKCSTAQNPVHTYTKAGNYTISLKVKNASGSTTATKSNYILVTALKPPIASYVISLNGGRAPLTKYFFDRSTGNITSVKWDFGDGTTSTTKNPSHTFTKAGHYRVSLTVSNEAGSSTKVGSIIVPK